MSRSGDADVGDLEARARAAIADLDLETLATARWTGLAGLGPARAARAGRSGERGAMPGADVLEVSLIDAFEFAGGGAIALVSVTGRGLDRAAGRPHDDAIRLTVPLEGPAPWIGLHRLASRGGTVPGLRGGLLAGHPGGASRADAPDEDARARPKGHRAAGPTGPDPTWRTAPGDQSHTSVVIDERHMLKLYRRLASGPNPEAEVLEALDRLGGAPVSGWIGSVEFEGRAIGTDARTAGDRSGPATIAIEQQFIPDAGDAFEVLADEIARWLATGGRRASTGLTGAAGRSTATLHVAMAGIQASEGPDVRRPSASLEERGRWLNAAEGLLDSARAALGPVDPDLATRLGDAEPTIRRALRPIGDPALPVTAQRIHGDLHLGQVITGPGGVIFVDFEGDPTRDPLARRDPAPSLRDVATFLRSIDHVARSGRRRAIARGARATDVDLDARVDAWIEDARSDFLAGYRTGLADPAWQPNRALLRALEVEKELGELIYAARFLPAWLYAPRAGMDALLGRIL